MDMLEKYLKSEIDLMLEIDHPNIVKLLYYFEEEEKMHLILELCPTGHLYRKLRRKGKFSEVMAVDVS